MAFNLPKAEGGEVLPVALGSATRVNLTAGAASSNAALPARSAADGVVIVRAVGGAIWLNFGSDAVTASAASTSILFAEGEAVIAVPNSATHAAVLRVGSEDVVVQLEEMK